MNNENTVKVWDILIRIFHWLLVAAFVIAYFTAEEENVWHIYSGYTVLGLIIFRIVWGLVGGQYARFSNFIYSPSAVFNYLKTLASKNPTHYLGHNPAGGWMIMALLVSLFAVTLSGLKLYAIEEGRGPLASTNMHLHLIKNAYAEENEQEDDDDDSREADDGDKSSGEKASNEQDENVWEEIHELSTNITLLLIVLHIIGVLVASRVHGENLIKAMITGKKKI